MALGSGVTPTSHSDSPSSTSPNNPSNDPGSGLTPNSSLPFSFLVTFIAIFLFFLGCGLGSRRVTRTLRRNLGLEVTGVPASGRSAPTARERPILWDVFPSAVDPGSASKDSAIGAHSWTKLIPLCATYIRPAPGPSAHSSLSSPAPRPPEPAVSRWAAGGMGGMGFALARAGMRSVPVPRAPPPPTPPTPISPRIQQPEVRWRGHRLPDFIARPLLPDSALRRDRGGGYGGGGGGGGAGGEAVEMQERERARLPVQGLQVVMLVAMPSPERARARRAGVKAAEAGGRQEEELELGEYAVGVARVPWDAAEGGLEGGARSS